MRIRVWLAAALIVSSAPAFAQGTAMPIPLAQWFDNSGAVLSAGGFCVYQAGTSTLATTYTTAALSVANANPILFDSAGRPSTGGVFLRPGSSYKFVLKNFAAVVGSPTCVPDTGVSLWTVDNVMAVPSDSGVLEIASATAGESISAGDAVYISDGSGSRTAGRWYKTDADFTYASSEAPFVGVAPASISSGQTGIVRIGGEVALSGPLSPGLRYWASATAGAITTTQPTNARQIGVGHTTTSLILSQANNQIPSLGPAYVINAQALTLVAQGRLTLTSGTPVTVNDVTAAATVYYTPYNGNSIALYNTTSSVWQVLQFSELSIALGTDTTSLPYDVFAYINAGAVAIERLAWTNTTTRATALTVQNSVPVKTGDASRRYLGTYYTTGAGQTADSFACRCVWNEYNRVRRPVKVFESTDSWTQPSSNAWRQVNGSTANQVAMVVGIQETPIFLTATGVMLGNGSSTAFTAIGVGGTTPSSLSTITPAGAFSIKGFTHAMLITMPAVGYSYYTWLERVSDHTVTTWYGDNGGSTTEQSGLYGWVES